MPSSKTVAVVVVYTGKNTVDALLLFLKVRKKEREGERERNSKTKQTKCRTISE